MRYQCEPLQSALENDTVRIAVCHRTFSADGPLGEAAGQRPRLLLVVRPPIAMPGDGWEANLPAITAALDQAASTAEQLVRPRREP